MRKIIVAFAAIFLGCTYVVYAQSSASKVMPHVLVYKTKAKYKDLVPVQLSPDKKRVVSYPGRNDLKMGGEYALPVSLHHGYLLDRRGVGWHTAFLKLTYEEYGKLAAIPDQKELYRMVIDKNPLTELYDCGNREPIPDLVHKINNIIDGHKLGKECIPVKK